MSAWVRQNPLPLFFLATLLVGVLLLSVAFFTISAFWGLAVTGLLVISAGHWITYLRTLGSKP